MHRLTIGTIALCAAAGSAFAQPANPVYTRTFTDAVTGDNNFQFGGFRFFDVDAGADSYSNDLYERPTAGGFELQGLRYAAEEYLGYLDLVEAKWGYDSRYVYVSMRVFNLLKQTKDGVNAIEGMKGRFAVRFSPNRDGRNGIILIANEPGFANIPNITVFTPLKTEGWRDTDADVGGRGGPIHGQGGPSGLGVTKDVNIAEQFGLNGYDAQFIFSDGLFGGNGPVVLWQRVSPTDPTTVEIALDYIGAGLTTADIEATKLLEFDADGTGLATPQLYRWNDSYTGIEAGSPNVGIGGDNEFGTQGLGAINGVDNFRAPVCDADMNFDGVADLADFFAFFGAYDTGDLLADVDGTFTVDLGDFFAFFSSYDVGC